MIEFKPIEGVTYRYDYASIFRDVARGTLPEIGTYRALILSDLFFIIYFVMKIPTANHKFVVSACKEVEEGIKDKTLDLWAREHFKSSVITTAEVVQKILKNPDERIAIFSHTRPIAKGFLRSIKLMFEGSEILKKCFPDILYENPQQESAKWSEDDGLIVKRAGYPKESTLEAWGLLEGMPTSKHFTHRIYDDIETADVVENPDTVTKLINRYNLSQNLGMEGGTHRVVGTTYSHQGILEYLKKKTDVNGRNIYQVRVKPATVDGTPNGEPVLLSKGKLDELRSDEYTFNCQQLLNPTPVGVRPLNSALLNEIDAAFIPEGVFKFMIVDPAGDSQDGKGDAWAMEVWGVEPSTDNIGASRVFLIDALISPLKETEAIEEIVRMYVRNGILAQIGIEKVGLSSVETHVANALAKQGRHISRDNDSLVLLSPAGRKKTRRIEAALAWPLYNGKIFISRDVKKIYRERFTAEMDKFPFWHDDGIDAASYLYDMIQDYKFAYMAKHKAVPQYEPDSINTGY